jgi:selenide,water dikinase
MGGTPGRRGEPAGLAARRAADELAAEVLRGGLDVAREAGCHVGGGHSVDDPEPKYGMAVTGVADPTG